MGLNILDIIFIVIILLSMFLGILKGFIKELLSLVFLVVATILSFLYYSEIGGFLLKYIKNKNISKFVGFVLIFVIVLIVGSLVTFFLKKIFVLGPLKSIDKILGGVFGLIRGILISCVIVFGLIASNIEGGLCNDSKLFPFFKETIDFTFNLVPDENGNEKNLKKQNEKDDKQSKEDKIVCNDLFMNLYLLN